MGLTSVLSRLWKSDTPRELTLVVTDGFELESIKRINTTLPLVLREPTGAIQPCAAESWTQEGTTWKFTLRPDVDPEVYRQGLVRRLADYASTRMGFPPFEKLKGFSDFAKGRSETLGLAVNGNQLIFDFEQTNAFGVLEALSTETLSLSPGAFALEEQASGQPLALSKSAGVKGEFDRVKILSGGAVDIPDQSPSTIMCGDGLPQSKPGFRREDEEPLTLGAIWIRPMRDMKNQRLRQILADQVEAVAARTPPEGYGTLFFATQPGTTVKRPPHPRKIRLQQELVIEVPAASNAAIRFIEDSLCQALKELAWPYRIERGESPRRAAAPHVDLRVQLDEVGDRLESWTVDASFLSPLGAQFADPSTRLKQAAKAYNAGTMSYDEFVIEFNQALHDDAAVLPLLHTGRQWLVSNDIEHFSPRFEEIRLKKPPTP